MPRSIPILFALLLCAATALAAPTKMDLNASYGATSFHTQGAMAFADLVRDYTGGSVDITVHPGGSLGFKGAELLKVVKDGQVPMSDILMGVVAGSEDVFGISSLPRLVPTFAEAHQLYTASKPLYDKAATRWNQKLLYAAPWPPSGLVTKNPVNAKADLQNLKTRTYDKNGANFLQALGASPLSLPWGEVYSSLRTGMIDSVLTSAESTNNGKFWEVLANFKDINYAFPLNMVTINLDYWNALSAEQQQAMLKAAAETEQKQWAASEERTKEALQAIQDNGIAVSAPDAALSAAMDEAAKQIIAEFKTGLKPEAKSVLEQFAR